MDITLTLFLLIPLIAATLFILSKEYGIQEFRLNLKQGIVLIRKDIPDTTISLGNYMELVVSQDGKIRKTHLSMVAKSDGEKIIENFKMVIDRKIKFRIKQFYVEAVAPRMRQPDGTISLPLRLQSQSVSLKAEFETFDYNSFEIRKGVHSLKLYFQTHDTRAVRRFRVIFTDNNARALESAKNEAMVSKQARIISIPIILI